jgi:LysM repeat protein
MQKIVIAVTGLLVFASASGLDAQALRGSRTAMRKQNAVAQKEDFSFLRTTSDVRNFVAKGLLVPIQGSSNVKLADVSFPYARPAVKTFVDRLGEQYQASCGEKLVVTSLTRPLSRQPRNAHDLSVHPTGMAVDLRRSRKSSCRRWLERTLLALEAKGVLDATRERNPAHYHVAVFPGAYLGYVEKLTGDVHLAERTNQPKPLKIAKAEQPNYASVVPVADDAVRYKVRKGDTLWSIARKHGLTVVELKEANGLKSAKIKPGQSLVIPQQPQERATE